jgi:hypothetical protein
VQVEFWQAPLLDIDNLECRSSIAIANSTAGQASLIGFCLLNHQARLTGTGKALLEAAANYGRRVLSD